MADIYREVTLEPVRALDLVRALRLKLPHRDHTLRLAIVGAGGKSSLIFHLAWELARMTGSVVLSTSTHLSRHQAELADAHFIIREFWSG